MQGQQLLGVGGLALPAALVWLDHRLKARDIAAKLSIGAKTVDTYRARLMAKLHCSSTAELVRYAIREGITKI